VGHVESHFGPFRDSVSIGVRQEHGLRQMYHRLRIVLNAQVHACFGPFGDSANLDARLVHAFALNIP
jgi:hypothetical protein